MYKIVNMDKGKYNNCYIGARYCLTKKGLKSVITTFENNQCDYKLYQFVHCGDGIFCWSETLDDKIYDYLGFYED